MTIFILDFLLRRRGLITALTHDLDEFLERCDPGMFNPVSINQLLGFHDFSLFSWDVGSPPPDVPPRLQGIPPGILFKREATPLSDWLLKIVDQGDTWLKTVDAHLCSF
ncbi:hypothetical protein Scep_014894 [Stephania cephalantha]|uniref:PHD finger protein ALFIN-LIKE n=1 Tax=Stephania cephalantha TaxID=152367 RepID=A0AAP0J415_9MAGN